jgi:capsular polysaccharide biosynthesis protein
MKTPQFNTHEPASSGLETRIFEIVALLGRNLKLIQILTIFFGTMSYGYSKRMNKLTYLSRATVFIHPKANANQIRYNGLLTYEELIDSFMQITKSNLVINEGYPTFLSNKSSKTDIVSAISIALIKDTEITRGSVVITDPNLSTPIPDIGVAVFITKVNSIMEWDNLKIIDTATYNTILVSFASLKNALIGALIGLMLVIVIFLRYLLNNTIKSAQVVKHYLGLAVLGEVHFAK